MNVNTVCIILGPYRNLTTLTASCCMLHPEIQVLNHGFSINKSDKTSFLLSYSDEKFDNFVFEVLGIARKGQAIPREGGVITASHAFIDYEIMRKTFYERYKNTHKENVRSIVWKDSHHNTNILMPSDFDDLLSKNHKLRFLLPIRNPMDCAVSNARSRKQLFGEDVETTEDVLEGIFKIYSWFFKFEDEYPLRFLSFFEFDMSYEFLHQLRRFLCVGDDVAWPDDVLKVWNLKKSYDHDREFISLCKKLVDSYVDDKNYRDKFHRFLE